MNRKSYVVETEAGRLWGPFGTVAAANKWAQENLSHESKSILNAYKIHVLYPRTV